jgi:hypothetical protein
VTDKRSPDDGDKEPNADEGGNPDRDREQHDAGKRPAEPDKG